MCQEIPCSMHQFISSCRYYWICGGKFSVFRDFALSNQANLSVLNLSIVLSHWRKCLYYTCMWFLLLQIYNCCPWKYMYIYAYLICLSCYLFCYVNKFKVSEIWIISQIFCVQTRSTATLTELRYTRGPSLYFSCWPSPWKGWAPLV